MKRGQARWSPGEPGAEEGRGANRAVVAVRSTREVLQDVADPSRLLTAAERDRADAFRYDADRDDFVAAHVLVRRCLAELLGGRAGDHGVVQRCGACGGPHGQPAVVGHDDVHVSWSHAAGAVAAVAAHGPCGIDVEPRTPEVDAALLDLTLTDGEKALVAVSQDPGTEFLRLWLRKEAIVKTGEAALDEVFSLDVREAGGGVLRPRTADGAAGRSWAITEHRSATHLAVVLTAENAVTSLHAGTAGSIRGEEPAR